MNLRFEELIYSTKHPGGKALGLLSIPKNIKAPLSYVLNGHDIWNEFKFKTDFEQIQLSSLSKIDAFNYDDLKFNFIEQLTNSDWRQALERISTQLSFPLIIRSNMSCEDNDGFSQAGLFQSYKVTNLNEFKEKSISIMAQVLSKEIIFNFLSHNIDFKTFYPSLLIQEYIEADYGGVYFSRSPGTPWQNDSYCEFNKGGAETITDGRTKCISYLSSEKTKPHHNFLNPIFKIGHQLEQIRKIPLDIEWLYKRGNFIILQVRPINSQDIKLAYKLGPGQRFDRSVTLERFPKKLSPLGWSALQSTFNLNLEVLELEFGIIAKKPEDISIIHDGIVYTDPNFFKFPKGTKLDLYKIFNPFSGRTWGLLNTFIMAPLTIAIKGVRYFELRLLNIFFSPLTERIISTWNDHINDFHNKLNNFKINTHDQNFTEPQNLLMEMDEVDNLSRRFLYNDLPIFLIKETLFKSVYKYFKKKQINTEQILEIFNNIDKNVTRKMSKELDDFLLLFKLEENQSSFLGTFDENVLTGSKEAWLEFISLNGHVINSWDILTPTWEEDPSQLISFFGLIKERKKTLKKLSINKEVSLIIEQNKLIKETILSIRKLIEIDEEQHFLSGNLLGLSRRIIKKASVYLVNNNILETNNLVYFLELNEIKSALSGNKSNLTFLAKKREAKWNRLDENNPSFTLSNEINPQVNTPTSELTGLGVSKGTATGVVQIIHQLKDFDPSIKSSILVLQTPNPVFTPFFSEVSGIISESGSFLSHGFVSAREYLLPAISEVKNITNSLSNGDTVSINGSTGEIKVLSRPKKS